MCKPVNWLKVASYDGQWADTVFEDRQQPDQNDAADLPPLSRSLRLQWALVLLFWVALAIVLALVNNGEAI